MSWIFVDPNFKVGDIVICRNAENYALTEGKEYVVLKYEPKWRGEGESFTWPSYVTFTDDMGRTAVGHASRFVSKEETTTEPEGDTP